MYYAKNVQYIPLTLSQNNCIFVNMNTLTKIGLSICTRRKELGYSQEKLALEAGLDRTYIPKVEKGKINITINSLEKIAKALGVKLIDLLK